MKIYHGSTVEIKTPKILYNEKGRDFGPAFYTTEIKEQAERWATRKKKIAIKLGNPDVKAIVSVYEYKNNDSSLLEKRFDEPSEEWLDMILDCRGNLNINHGYDIVSGKIADDSVGETVSFVMQGIMRKEDALERLKFQEINSQIALCTEKALKCITFEESYEVKE